MSILQLPFTLEGVSDAPSAKALGKLSPSKAAQLYAAGPGYILHSRRVAKNSTFAEEDVESAAERKRLQDIADANGSVDEYADLPDEPEDKGMLESDPKLWKEQDHYAVLGISGLRYKATPDQIKRAHRRKVLRHHPDKKASSTGEANADSFFKCIAKAYDVLSNPTKRMQFDSVDEGVDDDDVPAANKKSADAEEFCKLYGPVFEREGRFSKTQPVPQLGAADASKQEVESFYSFWYSFESWRSFEYLDKEANEGSDSRDEKRYAEKKNKSERTRRKKEDIARVRGLVDQAMALDPRIKRIKAEDKAAREAKRKGGKASGTATPADKEQAEAEAKAKAEADAKAAADEKAKADADKADRDASKKAREAAKKNLKREKKAASALLTSLNYLLPAGQAASASHVEAQLTEIDAIMSTLEPTDAAELRKAMEAKKEDREAVKKVVVEYAEKAGKKDLKGF